MEIFIFNVIIGFLIVLTGLTFLVMLIAMILYIVGAITDKCEPDLGPH